MPRTPFPGPHSDPFSAPSSWPDRVRRAGRGTAAFLASLTATYLGACVAALVLYAAVFPPITGVQLQRQVEGLFAGSAPERSYRPRPLTEIDPALPWAVVAAEDSRFFHHGGINWKAVGEAIEEYRRGEALRGASSITQQLVKNLFLTTHSTYLRKALEVPLTYAAEAVLSKRRILELYVNVIEWGPGVYGAEAAARHHYEQSARRLTRAQAAALAACIPNPQVRRPATVGWYQRIILRRMARLGRLPLSLRAPERRPSGRPLPPSSATALLLRD
jgi:monofunctional biosynthetic peptidoglycan transglycosylase